MLTVETITNQDIYSLKSELMSHPDFGTSRAIAAQLRVANAALEYEEKNWTRDDRANKFRALCAEIINARMTGAAHNCSYCGLPVHRTWDHLSVSESGEYFTCFQNYFFTLYSKAA